MRIAGVINISVRNSEPMREENRFEVVACMIYWCGPVVGSVTVLVARYSRYLSIVFTRSERRT